MNIDINGISITLTQEQLEQITEQTKSKSLPFPQKGDCYWSMLCDGNTYKNTTGDNKGRIMAYRTEEEAEQAVKVAFAEMRLKHAIEVANDGWTPDWDNRIEEKLLFAYNHKREECRKEYWKHTKYQPDWMYMKSGKA